MQLISDITSLRAHRAKIKGKVGFVATMGALHDGHLSLIESAKKDNDCTIVSIFVNPTQFGANEDFNAYPRNLESDKALCEQAGVDVLFAPLASEMYHYDEITFNPPKKMGYILEGFDRPTHFAGVIQVVLKLLCLTKPHCAYFGQKDAQQVLILQKMAYDLFLDVQIIPCPIKRDKDGLALSSRNIYLSAQERKQALCIPRAIESIKARIQAGEQSTLVLEHIAQEILAKEGVKVFYAGFYNYALEPIARIQKAKSLFLLAAQVGKTRLLDNLWI